MTNDAIIGIEFQFSRDYANHFARLFESVPVEAYTWYVSCSENYSSCNGKVGQFLPDGVYSGDKFASIIRSIPKYYIRLIRLFAVPIGKKFDSSKINYYGDYLKSNAEIALLSADSFVDFYAKQQNVLRTVADSCERYYAIDDSIPHFITLQNDTRTGFWI